MCLRGSSKRDTTGGRLRSTPSGSVRGSAAGGQVVDRSKPTTERAKRAGDVAQPNGALPMRWRLTGALRESIPGSDLEKLASCAP